MVSPALSDHSNARSHSNWMSASWRFSASSVDSTRPTGGPHCGSAMRRTIIRSMTCCTSSSLSSSTPTRRTVEASLATRSACAGSDSHLPSRPGDLRVAQLGLDNLAATGSSPGRTRPDPRPAGPSCGGMIAVCGIGMPSGCLNNAVTANQSASAPTMPASAAARTYPTQAAADPLFCAQVHTRKITVAAIRKPSATSFIRRSARCRSASASGSASAKDSANEPRVWEMPEMPAVPALIGRSVSPAGEAGRFGRAATTPSSAIPRHCRVRPANPVTVTAVGDDRPSVRGWS